MKLVIENDPKKDLSDVLEVLNTKVGVPGYHLGGLAVFEYNKEQIENILSEVIGRNPTFISGIGKLEWEERNKILSYVTEDMRKQVLSSSAYHKK